MNAISDPVHPQRLDWPLIAIFVLGPIQWITLAEAGLALKPVHLPLIWCALAGFAWAWGRPGASGRVDRPSAATALPFGLAYLAYLAVLLAAAMQAPETGRALALVIKIAAQSTLAAGLFLYLARLPTRVILDSLLWAGALAGLVFLAVAWATLAARGVSLPRLLGQALATGNAALLQFKLFLTLFNEGDWQAGGARTPASLRQVSLAFFYITGMVALARLAAPGRGKGLAALGLGLGTLLILASLSRSLILLCTLGGAVVCLGLLRRRADAVIYLALAGGLALAAFGVAQDASGVLSIVEARFGGIGEDGRLTQYRATLAAIAERPLLGHGTAHVQEFRAGARNMVHNLFLAAWVQAGVAGLLTALAFSAALAAVFLGRAWRFRGLPVGLALTALLLLPLLRSQLGGQGGNYTLPELIAAVLALALLYRPDLLPAEA